MIAGITLIWVGVFLLMVGLLDDSITMNWTSFIVLFIGIFVVTWFSGVLSG